MERDNLYSDFLLFMVVMGTRMRLTLGEHTQSWLKSLNKRKSMYFSPLEQDIFIRSYGQFEHILWWKATQRKQRFWIMRYFTTLNIKLFLAQHHRWRYISLRRLQLKHKKRIPTLRIDSVSQLTPGSLLQDPPQQDVTSRQSKHCAVDFIPREIQALG